MPTFYFEFTVDAPVTAVSDFHHDPRALKRLAPPPMVMQLREVEPLAEGSIAKFTMWVGPLPIHWTAVHTDVNANGFTDTQVLGEGPASYWKHTHRYTAVSPHQTHQTEKIEYEHGTGFYGVLTRILFAKPSLYLLFTYRKWATRYYVRRALQEPN